MEATVQTLAEARQVISSALGLCKHAGYKMGHAVDRCACAVCKTARLLREAGQELGSLERPDLEKDWH